MGKTLDALSSVAGRLTAGIAMAVAILVGLYPDHPRPVDPVRLGVVITTVLAWLLAEVGSGRKASPHDIALFQKVRELLPQATIDFLRHHDFKTAFHMDRQGGLHELASWEGSRYEFLDRALQRRWRKVHHQIKETSVALVQATGPVGTTTLLSANLPQLRTNSTSDRGEERINELNLRCSKLSESVDTFETIARARLNL
ncbi:MAG TPA: hypothetical protein VGD66_08650 [Allosphingosinicella sp.]|jgi:hypothetical protein